MNIKIEQGESEDLDGINDIYNYYVRNGNATFDTVEWDQLLRAKWYQQFIDNSELYKLFVAKLNGEVLGFAYNSKFKEKQAFFTSSEVTIYIRSGSEGNGLGDKLYQALLSAISNTSLHRLYAVITIPNAASICLHEKFGFYQVGTMTEVGFKNGQYHSTVMLEKDISDRH